MEAKTAPPPPPPQRASGGRRPGGGGWHCVDLQGRAQRVRRARGGGGGLRKRRGWSTPPPPPKPGPAGHTGQASASRMGGYSPGRGGDGRARANGCVGGRGESRGLPTAPQRRGSALRRGVRRAPYITFGSEGAGRVRSVAIVWVRQRAVAVKRRTDCETQWPAPDRAGAGHWTRRAPPKCPQRTVAPRPPGTRMTVGMEWLSEACDVSNCPPPPPPPRVQRTIKTSKNTVRTGVFVGHAIRHPINSVPKPGP